MIILNAIFIVSRKYINVMSNRGRHLDFNKHARLFIHRKMVVESPAKSVENRDPMAPAPVIYLDRPSSILIKLHKLYIR